MRSALITAFLLLAAYEATLAQSRLSKAKADSLWAVWNNPNQADSNRLKAMDRLAWKGYLYSKPDSAIYFAQLEYDLAKKAGLKNGMAKALHTQGAAYRILGDHVKALDHHKRSIITWEEIHDKGQVANVLCSIGVIYKEQGDHVRAIDHYNRALKIHEELGNNRGIAIVLSNIGEIYIEQNELDKALETLNRSMKISEEMGDRLNAEIALTNIGLAHGSKGDFPASLACHAKSLTIAEEIKDDQGIAISLTNMGNMLVKLGDHVKALDNYTRSLGIQEKMGDKRGAGYTYLSIGDLYRQQNDFQKALLYGQRALSLLQEAGDVMSSKEAAHMLFESYKATGQNRDALEMHELYIALRDSINSEQNQKEVMRQQFQYEFDKKEALAQAEQDKKDAIAEEQMRRKDQQRNAFIGGFVLMLGLAGVSYQSYRTKKKDNAIITQEKARSEELLLNILPHEVAEELKAKGEAEAQLVEHATVLFTDFKGFAQMSELVTPKELVRDLHECFSAFDAICERHGIEKIKTIGDAYMAAGGLPTPCPDHAQRVVRTALEMAVFIAEGKQRKIAAGLPYFEIRIGIHSGPVVAGIVGTKKFQYDIWGDTVNTASRMESSGEVGRVNISEATYQLVKDHFTCEYRGEIEAKGKGKMGMWFVSP